MSKKERFIKQLEQMGYLVTEENEIFTVSLLTLNHKVHYGVTIQHIMTDENIVFHIVNTINIHIKNNF